MAWWVRRLVARGSGTGSVLIFLTHNVVELDQFARGVGLGVYEAIARFEAVASERGA